jgi:tetratricopeptide (TPR) repeat protein
MTMNLAVKYSTMFTHLPPQPIRLADAPWAGLIEKKMEDGSEVQPWHCLPFVEGSTYGLELIYPYETECHVVGAGGTIQFDWDFAKEPSNTAFGAEFKAFAPENASRYYSFHTWVYMVAPPGHVLRTEPHPRFFTDETGTVPLAMIGHMQNEWYPRRVSIVFRAPRQGQRHIFRKGEPFVQILFVPQRLKYDLARMTDEEAARHHELENAINVARLDIATNVWHNPAGTAFSNHYKVLARAFARGGAAGVQEEVRKAVEQVDSSFPEGKPIAECMAVGLQRMKEIKHKQAMAIFLHVLKREPLNADAYCNLGLCMVAVGNFKNGIEALQQAAVLEPGAARYHATLGKTLWHAGRFGEAEASLRKALPFAPNNPELLSLIGAAMAKQGKYAEARRYFEAALVVAPDFPAACQGLRQLPNSSA